MRHGDGLSAALAALVTLVAVDAVVHVTRHIAVLEVGRVIPAMAARALKYRVVVRVDMARRTNVVGVAMTRREGRVLRVIERRTRPGSRVVTVLAGGGEELGLRRVARIRGVVVIGLMATDARGRQRRVIAVDVAIYTLPRRHSV